MKHALRSLTKSPGFTVTAILTLALGIGVNTSMFSGLNTLLFSTPYPDDGQLVRVYRTWRHGNMWPISAADFLDHRELNSVFERSAALQWTSFNAAEPGQPAERLRGLNVNADFFPMLGVQPQLGRVFNAEEDQPGKNGVVVLSHTLWLRRFHADPGVIGRELRLDGEPVTVIGVMPPQFTPPRLWGRVDAWRPIAFSDELRQNRGYTYLGEIARLKPGVTLSQAQVAMHTLAVQLASAHPEVNAHVGLRVVPLARGAFRDSDLQLMWLVASLTGFVLLIACANLANLLFARHAARARERAIRSALGASRLRLVGDVLAESLLLSLLGGALALLVAMWCNDALGRRVMGGIVIPINWQVLVFALGASVLTGLLAGVLPAWFSSRTNIDDALKQGARVATPGRGQQRLRHALIVAEITLALVLLASAGIFVRALEQATQRDPGWRIGEVLTGYISLPGRNYATYAQHRTFYERLEQRLAAIPGVERVAFGSSLPTWGFSHSRRFIVENHPLPAPGAELSASTASVSPEYFAALGLTLRKGRGFASSDREDAPGVVIINESMARAFWPDENPIGKRIGSTGKTHWLEIVGVVSDAAAAGKLSASGTQFQLYRPLVQDPGDIALALRTRQRPEAIASDIQRAVAAIDPDLSVHEIATVRGEIDRAFASGPGLAGYTLVGFALLGTALAGVGIYGVIAGFVAQRTNEIGIRMALGARTRDILRLVLGQGLRLALLGTVLGLAGTAISIRVLHVILPGLPPADPLMALAVTVLLLGVVALACWLPARRATKLNPVATLRAE